MSSLTALALLPLVGALIVGFLPSGKAQLAKQTTLAVTILVAAYGIYIATQFDSANNFYEERAAVSIGTGDNARWGFIS